jgi:hypothetical protein
MKSREDIERFLKNAAVDVSDAADARVQGKMHAAYEHSAESCPSRNRLNYWELVFESRLTRLVAAAGVFLALGVLVGQFGAMLSGGRVVWADVTQRFQSVPFFYASIYMRDGALAQPRQFELWMGKGGDTRLRVGSQVIFGRDGRVTRAFDVWSRREVEADETAADIVRLLAAPDEFSLETVIRSLSEGKQLETAPALNADAAIGEDLVVFEAQSTIMPGWVRIYALRESRLPVGLRIWDPTEGSCVDAMITYGKGQSHVFFDPNAFEAGLKQTGRSGMSLAYMFLKDPGGRDIAPDLSAEESIH